MLATVSCISMGTNSVGTEIIQASLQAKRPIVIGLGKIIGSPVTCDWAGLWSTSSGGTG